MTKRTQPASLIPIPATIDPAGRRCFKVNVPDDPTHIAAFQGMLGKLATWQAWQFDDAHSGHDLAEVWKAVMSDISECDVINIRLKPTDFCTLQLTTDGGVTWNDVADLSDCAHAAAVDEIRSARDRGDLSGGGQPPGQGDGTHGQCYDYFITLSARQQWIAPVALAAGDTISIDSESGAWTDQLLGLWNCADGSIFALGACEDSTGDTEETDPLPDLLHMRLIGHLPEDTTTPYFDMYETVYTVPSGVATGDFFLQPNDSDLSDNQGDITVHVQICKGGWTHVFDFAVDDGGWSVLGGTFAGTAGVYVAGTGWQAGDIQRPSGNYYRQLAITKTLPSRTITNVRVIYDIHGIATGQPESNARFAIILDTSAYGILFFSDHIEGDGLIKDSVTPQAGVTYIEVDDDTSYYLSNTFAGSTTIRQIIVQGLGTDPF